MGLLKKEEALKIEYEHLQDTIWQRTQVAWIVESILITGSLIVAFQSETRSSLTSFLSLILIIASFTFLVTTDKVDSINHARMEEIGEDLGIDGPKEMYEAKIEGKWWWVIRRNSWYGLFTILASVYLFLLTKKPGLTIVFTILCSCAIIARELHDWLERKIRRSNQKTKKSQKA